MVICRNPNCSKENSEDTVFCKYCGRRLKEPKDYSKLPLKMVAILGGLIILVIFAKMLSGGQGEVKKPAVNPGNEKEQKVNNKIVDNTLNYKFVFSRGKGAVKEIYIHNADGTTEQLTNTGAQNIYPNISPDGSKIVYERIENNNSFIYVMNVDGSGDKKLSSGHEPTFAVNSSKIFFYNKDTSSISRFLYSIKADGSGLNRETKTADSYNMARVSFDGNKIALTKYSAEGWGIYTVDPDFSGRKTLAIEKSQVGNPAWSKDGNAVVYQSMKNGNYDIYSVDLNKNSFRLTDSAMPDISPCYTPDGKIIFTREEIGTYNVYIMDGDGKNQKLVLKDAGFASVLIK